MKKILSLLFIVVLVGGCAGTTAPGENISKDGLLSAIKYVHDDQHNVGCWIWVNTDGRGSLTCLADRDYK